MGMGLDLAASKVSCDEVERLRRVESAACAVVEEYQVYADNMLLSSKMRALRDAIRGTADTTPAVLWDVDPKTAFARVGGKLVATVTEQEDGTWVLLSDDGRRWHPFRSLDAARRAFEESRGKKTAPARSEELRFTSGGNAFNAVVGGELFATADSGTGFWKVWFPATGKTYTLGSRGQCVEYITEQFRKSANGRKAVTA